MNNAICPLCQNEMKHTKYNGTHIYSCSECPCLMLEAYTQGDIDNLDSYWNRNKNMSVSNLFTTTFYLNENSNENEIMQFEARYSDYYTLVTVNNESDTCRIYEFNHQGNIRDDVYNLSDKRLLAVLNELYNEYIEGITHDLYKGYIKGVIYIDPDFNKLMTEEGENQK